MECLAAFAGGGGARGGGEGDRGLWLEEWRGERLLLRGGAGGGGGGGDGEGGTGRRGMLICWWHAGRSR